MKVQRHTVQHRLKCWGRWVQEPRHLTSASSSPFGRIADERNAAGNHGDGIRYEIIDGVPCPPDGGMAREIERRARAWGHDIRCRETHAAVAMLADNLRRMIIAVYVVPQREEPRSGRQAAEKLGIDEKTIRKYLKAAHERVSREIYGRFEVLPDDVGHLQPNDGAQEASQCHAAE